ncbi:MAG: glycosyltransferase [Ruminococcus sp.]|nr:glycosyltransferase [Ruminococcus sp.]
MKKKIIFVSKALWIGGIETALVNLLNNIDYDKYDVTCLVLKAELNMADKINPNCRLLIADREQCYTFTEEYKYSRLYHLTEESESPSKLHQLLMWSVPAIRWVENRLYIKYIRNLMKAEAFDTAIIYSDVVAEPVIRAIKASRYLMFYHHGAMRHVYHDKIGYKKSEKIIAVSENQANELKKFVPKYADKITFVNNLTDYEGIRKKADMPIEDDFSKDNFNIVSCGRISHEKGMDLAVKACAQLVADGFDNIKWWIVGGGPAENEVRDLVKELKMDRYVNMVGMKSNPYPYIKKADLYVQPSRFEGYPMTILEALVIGQPVFSTNNNGAKEIIRDGKTGLLFSTDVNMIADTVKRLLNCNDLLNELKSNVISLDFEKQNKQEMDKLQKFL